MLYENRGGGWTGVSGVNHRDTHHDFFIDHRHRLPTTAAYVLAVAAGGRALIKMGGELLSVHLFVFYFAILACVTPPVAFAAYAGAAIAKTDPLKQALGLQNWF